MRKKIPSFRLHVSEFLVDEPHELAILAVKFEFVRSSLIVLHHKLVYVISSRCWNFEKWPALRERSVVKNVFSFVVICFIVDSVEHHLVEENLLVEENAVDYSVWKKVRAGDGQRTSKNEVLVKEDLKIIYLIIK